jgi:hypothetical protein
VEPTETEMLNIVHPFSSEARVAYFGAHPPRYFLKYIPDSMFKPFIRFLERWEAPWHDLSHGKILYKRAILCVKRCGETSPMKVIHRIRRQTPFLRLVSGGFLLGTMLMVSWFVTVVYGFKKRFPLFIEKTPE